MHNSYFYASTIGGKRENVGYWTIHNVHPRKVYSVSVPKLKMSTLQCSNVSQKSYNKVRQLE